MLPDRVSNPGPLTYESSALPIALCGPAPCCQGKGIGSLKKMLLFVKMPEKHESVTVHLKLSKVNMLASLLTRHVSRGAEHLHTGYQIRVACTRMRKQLFKLKLCYDCLVTLSFSLT